MQTSSVKTSPRAQDTALERQMGAVTGEAKEFANVLFWLVPNIVAPTDVTQGELVGNKSLKPPQLGWLSPGAP